MILEGGRYAGVRCASVPKTMSKERFGVFVALSETTEIGEMEAEEMGSLRLKCRWGTLRMWMFVRPSSWSRRLGSVHARSLTGHAV